MRGNSKIKKGMTCDPQSAIWMGLTFIVFPFISSIASMYGYDPAASFGFGALASICVLTVELVTRRRVWFHDPCLKEWIEHPHLPFRVVGFFSVLLLLFLSFLIAGFLMSPILDRNVLRFVLNRQCAHPQSSWIVGLCRVQENQPETAIDPVGAAIRQEAARRMYPNSELVTCAQKTIDQIRDEVTVTRTAIVRCDQWVIGTIMRKPVSYQSTTALIMTKLLVQSDGSYKVQNWSDDSSSPEWTSIGQDIASSTILKYKKTLDTNLIQTELADETAQRANLFLSRE